MIYKRHLGLVLGSALSLGACQKDAAPTAANPAPAVPAPAPVRPGPTVAEQTKGMVEAAAQGKSPLSADLKFDLGQRPTVGQPLEVRLALVPHVDGVSGTIQISSGDGISVTAGSPMELGAIHADEVIGQSFTVTPTLEGVLLIGVVVAIKHDEITDSKAFSIPIIVDR